MRPRHTWGLFGVVLLLIAGGLTPAAALADSVAATGGATSVTATSGLLNGVIDPTYSDSDWFFEYSADPSLSTDLRVTHPRAAGAGLRAVSATVTGLGAAMNYYYRVVVVSYPDTTQAPVAHYGEIASFRTTANGKAPTVSRYGTGALLGRSLPVRDDTAQLVMVCRGTTASLCGADVRLVTRAARRRQTSCGRGEFVAVAPHRDTVRLRLSASCLSLIEHARGHRLTATLDATFSTHQAKLAQQVTLVR